MGIYLPNMEMPRKGQMLVIFPDGTSYVCFNGMRERLAQTEAVPVPPHGKLIDANKLIDRLQKQLNEAQAKVRAMGELNIGYTPDMYIVDRNRDMISILIAQAAFLPEEGA